ncbi:hypothetical protein Tco_1202768 [Tanacetum coccineum]
MVAFLNKSEGSEDFHQIIDFLNISHIKYALTENPTIYASLVQQFWETASASTSENEEIEITATIDRRVKTITEASIRRHLKLEDSDGIPTLPNAEIFEQLSLMSPKKTAWEQFSSNIATAVICLAINRTFNFSKMIFKGMLKNLDSGTYVAPTLTQKLFGNIRRVSKGYTREDIPLFPTMLTTPESSPARITSSPSLSPHTHPSTSQQPPTPPFMQTIHDAEEPATMPNDSSQLMVQSLGSDEGSLTLNELMVLCTTLSKKVEDFQNDLKQTKLTYGAAYTKLILRVKKLEHKVKASKSRRRARVIIFDNKEDLEDSYKQGRIIAEIDQNPSISLVQNEGTSWIQEDAETQGRTSADTKILLDQEEPTELVEDPGSGEKGEKDISTANISVSTACVSTTEVVLSIVIFDVSTTIPERLVYIRRSAEKRKDKGKAIMKDDESVQKKTKKQLEQERLGHEEAIRLQEQINKEERQMIARDAEIDKELQEEIDIARQEQQKYDLAQALELQKELDKRKECVAETTQAHDIDWSDPVVLRYHAKQNTSFSKAEPPSKRQKVGEVSGSVEEQSAGKEKEVSEQELKKLLVTVLVEEVYIEALQVKYPIIDWEVFTKESSYWRIIRVGNHTEVYQVFEDMLKRFDRDDLEKLWDLVKKKFSSTEPTIDKEKVVWVELKRLFKPDDDDTLWKLQRYMLDPLKWKLYDTCGVHHVSTERGHDIFMLVKKDY